MTGMRRVFRMAMTLAGLAVATVVVTPADAHDSRRAGWTTSTPSVFPQPRDPWRSWGVPNEIPKRLGPPHRQPHHGHVGSSTVWVPGQWVWDGATWVWWPGHWDVR